jgi:pimeloyl-ACP methyl ester carboxylesterase
MYYLQTGNPHGPAIVFLHALGTSGQMWWHITAPLQRDFHCIVVDLPGHGRSADKRWVSLGDTALQLKAIIQKETVAGQAHLAGLSFGAYAGLTLLRHYPECVGSALLSGINVLPFPHKTMMKALGWLISTVLKTDLMIGMNAHTLRIPEGDIPAYRLSVKELDVRSYRTANEEALNFTLPASDGTRFPPALFMAGEKEHRLVLESLTTLVATVPASKAGLVQGLGHGWSAENPALFAETLKRWIAGDDLPEAITGVDVKK